MLLAARGARLTTVVVANSKHPAATTGLVWPAVRIRRVRWVIGRGAARCAPAYFHLVTNVKVDPAGTHLCERHV